MGKNPTLGQLKTKLQELSVSTRQAGEVFDLFVIKRNAHCAG